MFLLHWPSAYAAQALPGTLPGDVRTFLEHDRQSLRAAAARPAGRTQHGRLTAQRAAFGFGVSPVDVWVGILSSNTTGKPSCRGRAGLMTAFSDNR